MRLIKAFLVGAIGLFVIITLFSLLIPSRVMVSRAVLVNNSSQGQVFQQIARIENWKNWHPIFKLDSASLVRNAAPDGRIDANYTILQRGKEISIQLISADTNSVKFQLLASGENDIENDIVLSSLPGQHAVQVEWRAITKLHWYPWEKFYGIFIDQLTGPGYDAALTGLKEYMENPLSTKGGN
jgi:hypothetical protein